MKDKPIFNRFEIPMVGGQKAILVLPVILRPIDAQKLRKLIKVAMASWYQSTDKRYYETFTKKGKEI